MNTIYLIIVISMKMNAYVVGGRERQREKGREGERESDRRKRLRVAENNELIT